MHLLPFPARIPFPVYIKAGPDGLTVGNLTGHLAEIREAEGVAVVTLRAGDEAEEYRLQDAGKAMRFAANWLMLRAMFAFSKN